MFEISNSGWNISGKDFLQWFVPAMLSLIVAGILLVWGRLGQLQTTQIMITSRITAIEANRFTASDGLELWKAVGNKVDREELKDELQEIKELIRDANN